ncbi:hypothetical protein ACIQFZ_40185 [Streptomyces sp. NPDC093064]|uniref:hypothetical protein n=1 Tax=Streptomyces sp. NPDC093064 TaxID=3366020 RepID=UPI0038133E97
MTVVVRAFVQTNGSQGGRPLGRHGGGAARPGRRRRAPRRRARRPGRPLASDPPGSWWYDGKDRPVTTGLNVDRYIANAGNSVRSLMDFTAMVDGKFPPQQEKFIDLMKDYLPPFWESLHDVDGGGFMYGGMQPGAWNDGAYGYVTVSRAHPDTTQYVHVTTRPTTGDQVKIRDNGHRVKGITDLRTGQKIPFDQHDGTLTIRSIQDWDPYDTVFKVETTSHRQGVYPTGTVTADDPALTDGDFTTYTDNKGKLPVSFTLVDCRG